MKVVILAGGLGTRLSKYTKKIPKPMVKIRNKPIIMYIIENYIKFGIDKFYIAAGYKYNVIKKYFKKKRVTAKINVINTGINSLTALRLKKLENFFDKNEDFFMTYGDAVSNVNFKKELKFHRSHGKIATILSVHPPARFGELKIKKNLVLDFEEKPQMQKGWINGGFFVLNSKIFKYLSLKKNEMFERGPIKKLTLDKNLMAFKHNSFWMCMDTPRDKLLLETKIKYYFK